MPGESHGQRNLVGYSPCSHQVSHTAEGPHAHVLYKQAILTHTNPFLLRYWVLRTFWVVYCDEFIRLFFVFVFGRRRSIVPIFLCLRANRKTVFTHLKKLKSHSRNGQNYAQNTWNILPFCCFSFHIYIYICLGSLSFSLDVSIWEFRKMQKPHTLVIKKY